MAKYGGIPPYSETQHYVKRVLAYYDRYRMEGKPRDRTAADAARHGTISN